MTRRPGIAVAAGVAGIGGLLLTWLVAFHSARAMDADRSILDGFVALHKGRLVGLMDAIPHLSDPKPFAVWTIVILATALARNRPRSALAAGAVLAGANLTTHLLKAGLGDFRATGGPSIGAGSWPSGHATASMSVALCAIVVAPAILRPTMSALGAAYSLAVTFTLLADGWHFPSDVVAGYLMAGTWTAFAVAAVWASERRWAVRPAPSPALRPIAAVAPAIVVGLAGLVLFGLIALARPVRVTDYARAHTLFVVGAGLIAALGLSLVAGLAAALTTTGRPSGSAPAPREAPRPGWPPERG